MWFDLHLLSSSYPKQSTLCIMDPKGNRHSAQWHSFNSLEYSTHHLEGETDTRSVSQHRYKKQNRRLRCGKNDVRDDLVEFLGQLPEQPIWWARHSRLATQSSRGPDRTNSDLIPWSERQAPLLGEKACLYTRWPGSLFFFIVHVMFFDQFEQRPKISNFSVRALFIFF